MYKKIFSHVGKYKKYAILAPIAITGEVVMEVLIPFVMANIINNGIRKGDTVAETLHSQCRRPRFNPWSGN